MNRVEHESKNIYIPTSIPYVNAQPHIGHALEMVQADALARYHRLQGHHVRQQSGADENALKNVQAAEREGVDTARPRLDTVLYVLLETLRLTSHYLAPFLPGTAVAIRVQLGLPEETLNEGWSTALRWGQLEPGQGLPPAQPLFPKQE